MAEILKDRNWYDTAWRSRAKITINKDLAVGTTQVNYPVKITSLDHVIYGLSKADGSDLLFTYQNEPIRRDVVSFDRSARTCEIYVELPSLDGSEDTVIYCYFNNPDVTLLNDRVDHSITRRIRVAASADDALVYNDGAWKINLTANYNRIGYSGAADLKNGSGMRLLGLLCPKYSIPNQSYLVLTCQTANAEVVINSRLIGELSGTPATFSTIADYQARRGTSCGGADNTKRTAAAVDWDAIAAWVLDTEYNSPSLNALFTEMLAVNSLQDAVIFHDDHDARGDQVASHLRYAYSYDASTTKCPLLVLDFTPILTNYQTLELQYIGLGGNW